MRISRQLNRQELSKVAVAITSLKHKPSIKAPHRQVFTMATGAMALVHEDEDNYELLC